MQNTPLQPEPQMAEDALSTLDVVALAASRARHHGWQPFATATDRAVWDDVDPVTRGQILEAAQQAVDEPWPALTASAWVAFATRGDRRAYEDAYFSRRRRLSALALALALDTAGPWLTHLLDGIWSVLEETSWCVPAHDITSHSPQWQRSMRALPDPSAPTVDLFAAETAATLSSIAALHGGRGATDPSVREVFARIAREVDGRVLRPFEDEAEKYHWFGLASNWNPWIISNVLLAALLNDLGRDRWAHIAALAQESLIGYRAGVPADGGSAEGLMYWWQSGARYFESLELLTAFDPASRARIMTDPLLGRIARYPLVVHLGGPWSANFGDGGSRVPAPSRGVVKERHPYGLLHRFARHVRDEDLARFARSRRGTAPLVELPVALSRALVILSDTAWRQASELHDPSPRSQFLDRLEILTTRETGGRTSGLALVAKGGHNGEPHNHNDVGSFIVASDGVPVIIDAGTGTYTRESFGPSRYKAWFTRSNFHNTPTPADAEQPPGAEYRARDVVFRDDADQTSLEMELVEAYPPSMLRSWRRTMSLHRRVPEVVVEDQWFATDPLQPRVHLLLAGVAEQRPGIVVAQPPRGEAAPPIEITCTGGDGALAEIELETIALDDAQLAAVWGDTIVRMTARPSRASSEGLVRTSIRQLGS